MLQMIFMFAFMLTPIWIILISAAVGWIGDRLARLGQGGSTLVLLRATRTEADESEGSHRRLDHKLG